MFLASAGDTWRQDLSGTLTVQIPVSDEADRLEQVNAVAELLRTTPGVVFVRPIPDAEIAVLLEPWLGKQVLELELPMP
jgi:cell division transport system permease protein